MLLAACTVPGGSGTTTGASGPNPCLGNHQATQNSSGGLGAVGTPTAGSTGTPVPADQQIHLNIALNINYAALDACTQAIYNPSSPAYGQYLTQAEIAANFAPSAADVAKLTSYLTGDGLQVTSTYATNASLSVNGTAAQVEKAFNVQMVTTQANTTQFYAPDRTPTLPSNLESLVGSITGLKTEGTAHCNIDNPKQPASCGQISHYSHINVPANLSKATPSSAKKAANGDCTLAPYGLPLSGSLPTQQLMTWDKLQTAYGLDKLKAQGFDGGNTAIGMVEFDTYSRADIVNYMTCAGTYAQDRLQIVPVDVKSSDPAADSAPGAGEAELDLEMATGLTGKNTKIIDYYSPNNAQWEIELQDILQKVASDKKVSVLSISYGDFEADLTPSYMATIDNSMKLLASEGISVFVASGDCAAYGAGQFGQKALSFPASAPNAIAVGGTSIPADLVTGALGTETAWGNDSASASAPCQNTWGSGGGLSIVPNFTIPVWQKGPGVSNQYSNGERQVPDVSAAAINISFYYDIGLGTGGLWLSVGGTSAAAPIWAAGTAVVDQYLASKGKPPLGGVAALYTLANDSSAGSVYHDITLGDNLAYKATTGWDYVTGWGSPHFDQIATTLGG